MKYKLFLSQNFEDDLEETLFYISNSLNNPAAASRLLNKTETIISNIAANPFLYPVYHDKKLAAKGYRYAVIANYLLFYFIDEADETIFVARFIYGSRNLYENIK